MITKKQFHYLVAVRDRFNNDAVSVTLLMTQLVSHCYLGNNPNRSTTKMATILINLVATVALVSMTPEHLLPQGWLLIPILFINNFMNLFQILMHIMMDKLEAAIVRWPQIISLSSVMSWAWGCVSVTQPGSRPTRTTMDWVTTKHCGLWSTPVTSSIQGS